MKLVTVLYSTVLTGTHTQRTEYRKYVNKIGLTCLSTGFVRCSINIIRKNNNGIKITYGYEFHGHAVN